MEVSAGHAVTAAQLRPVTRDRGLSLGDRLCLALALEHGARVMTTEQIWGSLDLGLKIDVIRKPRMRD